MIFGESDSPIQAAAKHSKATAKVSESSEDTFKVREPQLGRTLKFMNLNNVAQTRWIFSTLRQCLLPHKFNRGFVMIQPEDARNCDITLRTHSVLNEANVGIETLPVELLNDIWARLDFEDVLRLREVSRYLNYTTHTRSTWLALVKRSDIRFMANARFELYTAQELETIVRQKARRDANRSSNTSPVIARCVSIEGFIGWNHLLPGGRWLVSMTLDGGVVYNDLDSNPCVRRTLVPGLSPDTFCWQESCLFVDVNQACEYLTFNLLLVTSRCISKDEISSHFPSIDITTRYIQVFNVSVKFDDSGYISGLKAECLSSFDESSRLCLRAFSLSGETLAYQVYNPPCAILVEWRKANGKILDFPRRRLNLKTLSSALLSETVFVAWTGTDVLVYDLAALNLPVSTDPPSGQDVTEDKFWSSPCPHLVPLHIRSPPIPADTSTSILFSVSKGILNLTVPKSLSQCSPSLVMSSMQPTHRTCVFKAERGVALHDTHLITYRYNKAEDGTITSIDSFTREIFFPGECYGTPKIYLDDCSNEIFVRFLETYYVVDLNN